MQTFKIYPLKGGEEMKGLINGLKACFYKVFSSTKKTVAGIVGAGMGVVVNTSNVYASSHGTTRTAISFDTAAIVKDITSMGTMTMSIIGLIVAFSIGFAMLKRAR